MSRIKVYDPRDNTWKISDNPALILGYLIDNEETKKTQQIDWDWIRELANICDSKVMVGNDLPSL